MRLLVISDTHGNYPLLLKLTEIINHIDTIIHLGDGEEDAVLLAGLVDIKVIRLAGNCDPGSTSPREILWNCEGKHLFFLHGDRYGVKQGLKSLEQRAIEIKADAVFYGHTHIATNLKLSDILFVNPGTLMKGAGFKSYAIVDVSETDIEISLHQI
jgi:putative phosphoesterase